MSESIETPDPRWLVEAASLLIERLDDLYDQRPKAIPELIAALHEVIPVLTGSELGALADDALNRLREIERVDLEPVASNLDAVRATGDLRIAVAEAL